MRVEVLVDHDCEKPVIPYKEITKNGTRRNWLGIKVKHTTVTREYKYKMVRWTCPVCKKKWEWNHLLDEGGIWLCIENPQNWQRVEL